MTMSAKRLEDKADEKPKPIPAAKRTLSLFTNRTDLDDPERARDGSLPQPKRRVPRARKTAWIGSSMSWTFVESPDTKRERTLGYIEGAPNGWKAYRGGPLGTYPTMLAAATAVERAA